MKCHGQIGNDWHIPKFVDIPKEVQQPPPLVHDILAACGNLWDHDTS